MEKMAYGTIWVWLFCFLDDFLFWCLDHQRQL